MTSKIIYSMLKALYIISIPHMVDYIVHRKTRRAGVMGECHLMYLHTMPLPIYSSHMLCTPYSISHRMLKTLYSKPQGVYSISRGLYSISQTPYTRLLVIYETLYRIYKNIYSISKGLYSIYKDLHSILAKHHHYQMWWSHPLKNTAASFSSMHCLAYVSAILRWSL